MSLLLPPPFAGSAAVYDFVVVVEFATCNWTRELLSRLQGRTASTERGMAWRGLWGFQMAWELTGMPYNRAPLIGRLSMMGQATFQQLRSVTVSSFLLHLHGDELLTFPCHEVIDFAPHKQTNAYPSNLLLPFAVAKQFAIWSIVSIVQWDVLDQRSTALSSIAIFDNSQQHNPKSDCLAIGDVPGHFPNGAQWSLLQLLPILPSIGILLCPSALLTVTLHDESQIDHGTQARDKSLHYRPTIQLNYLTTTAPHEPNLNVGKTSLIKNGTQTRVVTV